MTKIKKKLTFFRRGDLPKQSGPPRRSFAARSGAFRGVTGRHGAIHNWTSGLSPNPYTHARINDWR